MDKEIDKNKIPTQSAESTAPTINTDYTKDVVDWLNQKTQQANLSSQVGNPNSSLDIGYLLPSSRGTALSTAPVVLSPEQSVQTAPISNPHPNVVPLNQPISNQTPVSQDELAKIDEELKKAKQKTLDIQQKIAQMNQSGKTKPAPVVSSAGSPSPDLTEYNLIKNKLNELEKKYGTENAQAIAKQLIDLHNKEIEAAKTAAETTYETQKQKAEHALAETTRKIERGYQELGYKPGFAGSTLESLNRDIAYANAQFQNTNALLEKAKQEALARAEATQSVDDWNRYNTIFNNQTKLIDEHLKNISALQRQKSEQSLANYRTTMGQVAQEKVSQSKLENTIAPFVGSGTDWNKLSPETQAAITNVSEEAGIPIESVKQAIKNKDIKGTAKIGDTVVFYDKNGSIIKSVTSPESTSNLNLINGILTGDIKPTDLSAKTRDVALNELENILNTHPILRMVYNRREELANELQSGRILTGGAIDLGKEKYLIYEKVKDYDKNAIKDIENAFQDLSVQDYLKRVAVSASTKGVPPKIENNSLLKYIPTPSLNKIEESNTKKGKIQELLGE